MIIKIEDLSSYVISLPEDFKKFEKSRQEIMSTGIKVVNGFDATRNVISRTGLAISFKRLFSSVGSSNLPYLICEDDVLVNPDFNLKEFYVPDDADAVYVGLSVFGKSLNINPYEDPETKIPYKEYRPHSSKLVATKISDKVYRIYNMLSAHAVIMVSQRYVDFLKKSMDIAISSNGHQDSVRALTMPFWNIYALDIPMLYQSGDVEKFTKIQLSNLSEEHIDFNIKRL
jgi:hypothetical protein